MMSMASSTVGDAMNYVEDTIGEELEKTALKGLRKSIAKHKGKVIGLGVGAPVAYSLFQSAREADREAGGIPQALDDAMDGVDSGLDEVDRVMDEGFSDKQKALAALGALGLAGVGGYKAYKSLSGREKVSKLSPATKDALKTVVPFYLGLGGVTYLGAKSLAGSRKGEGEGVHEDPSAPLSEEAALDGETETSSSFGDSLTNKQKAALGLGAAGLVGALGYGAYRGLTGSDKKIKIPSKNLELGMSAAELAALGI